MSRLLLAALLLLVLWWMPSPAAQSSTLRAHPLPDPPGGVQLDEREVYYEVQGSTGPELGRAMRALGPAQARGRFTAYTDVRLRWDARWEPAGGECATTWVRVSGTVEMQMPRWRPAAQAAPELARQWAGFATALRAHEHGHRDLARAQAGELHGALSSLRTPSCAEMQAAAERIVADLNRVYTGRSRDYDRQTGHGRTQGAYWPW